VTEFNMLKDYINTTLVDKAKEIANVQVAFNKTFNKHEEIIEQSRSWCNVFACALEGLGVCLDEEGDKDGEG